VTKEQRIIKDPKEAIALNRNKPNQP
jgi:hypothetical protein